MPATSAEWEALLEAQRANFQLAFDMQVIYMKELEWGLSTFGIDVHTPDWHDKLPKPPDDDPHDPFAFPLTLPLVVGISGSSNMAGAGDRTFSKTGVLEPPVRRSKVACPRLDHSWKPSLGTTITEAITIAAVSTLLDDDFAGIWHESDVDYRQDGDLAALNDKKRMKEEFYDHVVRLRLAGRIKRIWVPNIVSSYSVSTPALIAQMPLYDVRADIIGFDIDGGNFPKDYGDAKLLATCRKWADDNYHGNLTFPEWGWKDDPAGGRMAVITSQLAHIVTARPLMVVFHDNPSFGAVLTAAERVEFARLVAQFNAPAT